MVNKGTEYEKLVQEIYQALLNNDDKEGIKNISVQHNIKLTGKSGCEHQIDVYWEFESMGKNRHIAIECKNYSSTVSVGKIRDFFGVLHDVGDIKGIFITKVGYQSGAKKFADCYGIELQELRFPTDKDWEGRIKNIVWNINAIYIVIKKRIFDFDSDWRSKNYKKDDEISLSATTDKVKIEEAGQVRTLHEIEDSLPRDREEMNKEITLQFTDAFLLVEPTGPRLKINGIRYLYDVISLSETSITEGDAIVKAILKDVRSGATKFFDQDAASNIKVLD